MNTNELGASIRSTIIAMLGTYKVPIESFIIRGKGFQWTGDHTFAEFIGKGHHYIDQFMTEIEEKMSLMAPLDAYERIRYLFGLINKRIALHYVPSK